MSRPNPDESLQLPAGILACIIPGAGYLALRDPARAAALFAGVMGLWLGGLLLGGIDSIDRREDKWWFLLQAGVGPATFAVNAYNQSIKIVPVNSRGGPRTPSPFPDENPGSKPASYSKSLGHVNEIASLSIALAGMLNVIAVIDCFWHAPASRRRRAAETPPQI